MITVTVVGAEIAAAAYRREVRAFQLEQRKVMRQAANVVKKDVEAKVSAIFPTSTQSHKRSGGTPLGPLRKKIRARVFNTTGDVLAFIRPAASAFYGRFQETGLFVMRKGRTKNAVNIKSRKATRGSSAFRLQRKPFLEPVANVVEDKVAEIIGSAYGVFYTGGV